MTEVLAWTAVALALCALVVAGLALRQARAAARRRPRRPSGGGPVPADLGALRDEVETLGADAAEALRHVAVVRYDAFGDMGG